MPSHICRTPQNDPQAPYTPQIRVVFFPPRPHSKKKWSNYYLKNRIARYNKPDDGVNNMLMRVYETMSCSLGEITRDPLTHCPGEETPPHPQHAHTHTVSSVSTRKRDTHDGSAYLKVHKERLLSGVRARPPASMRKRKDRKERDAD